MNWAWMQHVVKIAPLALAYTPLAPIAPFVALGITEAEQMAGTTGAEKLEHAVAITKASVEAINASRGRQILNPSIADQMIKDGIMAVVSTANVWHGLQTVHGTPPTERDVSGHPVTGP